MPLMFVETPTHLMIPMRVSLQSYGDTLGETVANLTLAAGDNYLSLDPVPAGVLHVYTNLAFRYSGTVAAVGLYCQILLAAGVFNLFSQTPPANFVLYDRQGFWVLKEDERLRLYVTGATLNDDAWLYATGYTVDLA